MRTAQTILIFFLVASKILSQPIVDELLWAKEFKDNGLSSLLIEADSNDNILVAGVYRGCTQCYIEWEGDTIIAQGNNTDDVFMAKISGDGILLWSLLIGEEGDEVVSGFRVDNNNDIILYIENEEEFTYSSIDLESGHNLLKFDGNGQLLWNSNIKGARHNSHSSQFLSLSEQLSISCNNDIVIGGSIRKYPNFDIIIDTLIWGTDTIFEYLQVFDTLEIGNQIVPIDTNNIFIAKLESNGNLQWVKTFEHNGWLGLSSLDATKSQEINVLGFFQNEDWIVGGNLLSVDTIDYLYKRNIYILKLDESGELIWANKYFDDVLPRNITTDNLGNIISTGYFQPITYFEQDTISVNGSADDIILFVVDSTGNYMWGTNAGDQSTNQNCYVLTNSDNDIYLSGSLASHLGAVMNKYSSSGDLMWELNPTESGNRNGGDIAFDNSGNLVQTGIHTGNFIIGNDTLGNAFGAWHQYILKFGNQTEPDSIEDCGEITSMTTVEHEFSSLKVFPNPTTDKLFINIELVQTGNVDIFLFSLEGKLLAQKRRYNVDKEMENFNVENFPSGTYLLKIVSEGTAWSELIIKI